MSELDELNLPLGKKRQNINPGKTGPSHAGNAFFKHHALLSAFGAVLALGVLGFGVLGLVVWDRSHSANGLTAGQLTVTSDKSIKTATVKADKIELDDDGALRRSVEGIPDEKPENRQAKQLSSLNEGFEIEKGFEEIRPSGSLSVLTLDTAPKPAPRPNRQDRLQTASLNQAAQSLSYRPEPDLVEPGPMGTIPKRAENGRRPMDAYAREPAMEGNTGLAQITLIVGGIGISQTASQQAIDELPASVVLAFAPYGNSLDRWMKQARQKGHELLLQVPMQSHEYPRNNPGPHTLLASASGEQNLSNLYWMMGRLTNYVGVVNYMGAKMMSEPTRLEEVFGELADRGLLFVDDGTAQKLDNGVIAERSALPFAKANLVLDNSRDKKAIKAQLAKLEKLAKQTGSAIGMASAFPETIAAIKDFTQSASLRGVTIMPVSALVDDPERKLP